MLWQEVNYLLENKIERLKLYFCAIPFHCYLMYVSWHWRMPLYILVTGNYNLLMAKTFKGLHR